MGWFLLGALFVYWTYWLQELFATGIILVQNIYVNIPTAYPSLPLLILSLVVWPADCGGKLFIVAADRPAQSPDKG